jgi:hypothetical protein
MHGAKISCSKEYQLDLYQESPKNRVKTSEECIFVAVISKK